MKDRIKEYMDYKGISAGELASILEVQRSNISHILNGRNKPGATFIEKLLVTYPDLNARWLLTGKGEMLDSVNKVDTTPPKDSNTNFMMINQKADVLNGNKTTNNQNKLIDKVLLLLSDGTFIDYTKK